MFHAGWKKHKYFRLMDVYMLYIDIMQNLI